MSDYNTNNIANAQRQKLLLASAIRKVDSYAINKAIAEKRKNPSIDIEKRRKEIFKDVIQKLRKEQEENVLLSDINEIVDRKPNNDAQKNELDEERLREISEIHEKSNIIFEEMKREQQSRKVKKELDSIDICDKEVSTCKSETDLHTKKSKFSFIKPFFMKVSAKAKDFYEAMSFKNNVLPFSFHSNKKVVSSDEVAKAYEANMKYDIQKPIFNVKEKHVSLTNKRTDFLEILHAKGNEKAANKAVKEKNKSIQNKQFVIFE